MTLQARCIGGHVCAQAALSWQRVLIANWLSSSGADWAKWVAVHNSGTYNNQVTLPATALLLGAAAASHAGRRLPTGCLIT